MSLKSLAPDDPILRKPCLPISLKELRLKKTQNLIDELLEFVYRGNNKGDRRNKKKPSVVGLSANQVGISKQIAIVDLSVGHNNFNDIHTLINPRITWSSKSKLARSEGCVNLPSNIRGTVARSYRVKAEAYDRSGNKLYLDVHGWPAILLQHETDHLHGKLFIDHLEDPKKAHLVNKDQYQEYKRNYKTWNQFVDVSKLAK